MEVSAVVKNVHISEQKVRLVVDQVRGKKVNDAFNYLNFSTLKAAKIVSKLLASAVANAENNNGLDVDELKISELVVTKATPLKRVMPRAKGRANRIVKHMSHIFIKVNDSAEGVKS